MNDLVASDPRLLSSEGHHSTTFEDDMDFDPYWGSIPLLHNACQPRLHTDGNVLMPWSDRNSGGAVTSFPNVGRSAPHLSANLLSLFPNIAADPSKAASVPHAPSPPVSTEFSDGYDSMLGNVELMSQAASCELHGTLSVGHLQMLQLERQEQQQQQQLERQQQQQHHHQQQQQQQQQHHHQKQQQQQLQQQQQQEQQQHSQKQHRHQPQLALWQQQQPQQRQLLHDMQPTSAVTPLRFGDTYEPMRMPLPPATAFAISSAAAGHLPAPALLSSDIACGSSPCVWAAAHVPHFTTNTSPHAPMDPFAMMSAVPCAWEVRHVSADSSMMECTADLPATAVRHISADTFSPPEPVQRSRNGPRLTIELRNDATVGMQQLPLLRSAQRAPRRERSSANLSSSERKVGAVTISRSESLTSGGIEKPLSHGSLEKQRRDRINFLIDELSDLVPSTCNKDAMDVDGSWSDHIGGPRAKHAVLADTIAYIRALMAALLPRTGPSARRAVPMAGQAQGDGVGGSSLGLQDSAEALCSMLQASHDRSRSKAAGHERDGMQVSVSAGGGIDGPSVQVRCSHPQLMHVMQALRVLPCEVLNRPPSTGGVTASADKAFAGSRPALLDVNTQ